MGLKKRPLGWGIEGLSRHREDGFDVRDVPAVLSGVVIIHQEENLKRREITEMSKLEWYRLYSDSEPIIEKELLNKILSTGSRATFALVRHDGEYKAMLFVNGKRINGPPVPQLLSSPKDDVTHWMGNKPGVGLTTSEAEMITRAVDERNQRAA